MKLDSKIAWILPLALSLMAANGCGKADSSSSATEDTSASGMAAASVGGALSASSSNGTQSLNWSPSQKALYARVLDLIEPEANASNACPTLKSSTGCTSVNSTTVDLGYGNCSFGLASATWAGTLEVSVQGGSLSCGSFPNPSGITEIDRQFVDASHDPSTGSRTSAFGTTVTIDHQSSNLGNFDTGTTITGTVNGHSGTGYGTKVTFSGGARTQAVVQQRISSPLFDMSLDGSVSVSESAGASSRTVSGHLTVYHNKLKVVGTSTFDSVVFSDGCCTPTGGSVTTAYAAGAHVQPTTLGSKLVGKSETLTFTGTCGSASLKGTDGNTSDVTLSHCF